MNFGLFLLAWLFAGFLVGIKVAYVEQGLDGEKLEKTLDEFYKNNEKNERSMSAVAFATNKKNFIIISTLFGFIALFAEIIGTFKKIKNHTSKQ